MGVVDFSRKTNTNVETTGFQSVVFGANGALLEVELNEMQALVNERLRKFLKSMFGDCCSQDALYVIDNNVFLNGTFIIDGYLFTNSDPITVDISETNQLYLGYKIETITGADKVHKDGIGNEDEIDNTIIDTRVGIETSRREILSVKLVADGTSLPDDYNSFLLVDAGEPQIRSKNIDSVVTYCTEYVDKLVDSISTSIRNLTSKTDNLAEDVDEINSNLEQLPYNLIDLNKVVSGKKFDTSDVAWSTTDYIFVKGQKSLSVCGKSFLVDNSIEFYDESKKVISTVTKEWEDITNMQIPSNAVYCRITIRTYSDSNDLSTVMLCYGNVDANASYKSFNGNPLFKVSNDVDEISSNLSNQLGNHTVKSDVPENAVFTDTVYDDTEVKESIDELNSNLSDLAYGDNGGYNIFKDTTWIVGKHITENGINDYDETGSAYSDYISIVEPNTYYISSSTHPKSTVFEYDANKSFIKHNGWKKDKNTPCVLSGNCAYIRISFNGASSNIQPSNVMLAKTPNLPYEPYIPSVKMLAEEKADKKETTVNLFKPPLGITTKDEVEFITRADGSISISGTPGSNNAYTASVLVPVNIGQTYKVIGKFIGVYKKDNINRILRNGIAGDTTPSTFTATEDFVNVCMYVSSNDTIPQNGVISYPMLTTNLDATYDDFVPYTGDSGSLNGDVADIKKDVTDLIEGVDSLSKNTRVNLFNQTLKTATQNGVTCTNNGDGTYTLNGTASATTYFTFQGSKFNGIKKGCKLIGCPPNGSPSTYSLNYSAMINGKDQDLQDFGNGSEMSDDGSISMVSIEVINGATLNGVVFKPMITYYSDATYDDYIPYTGSTGTLCGDVSDIKKSIPTMDSPLPIHLGGTGYSYANNACNNFLDSLPVNTTNVDDSICIISEVSRDLSTGVRTYAKRTLSSFIKYFKDALKTYFRPFNGYYKESNGSGYAHLKISIGTPNDNCWNKPIELTFSRSGSPMIEKVWILLDLNYSNTKVIKSFYAFSLNPEDFTLKVQSDGTSIDLYIKLNGLSNIKLLDYSFSEDFVGLGSSLSAYNTEHGDIVATSPFMPSTLPVNPTDTSKLGMWIETN